MLVLAFAISEHRVGRKTTLTKTKSGITTYGNALLKTLE